MEPDRLSGMLGGGGGRGFPRSAEETASVLISVVETRLGAVRLAAGLSKPYRESILFRERQPVLVPR